MATAIPYAETQQASERRNVTLGWIIGVGVFAIAVFALALALIL